VLHRLNFDVEQSFDGLDALRRCQSAKYDLIVCDVRMPRLGGLSLLSNIAQTENALSPVIMLSAIDDASVRRQALASGAVAYLVKPVTADALKQAVMAVPL
jgi:CheY-like chemotaxis protein